MVGGVSMDMVVLPDKVIPALIIVVCAIILDVVLGVAVKLINKEFNAELLPKFLITGVLPYLGSLLVLGLLAEFVGVFFISVFYMAATAVIGKYVVSIKTKLSEIFIK